MPLAYHVRAGARAAGNYVRKLAWLSCATIIMTHAASALEPQRTSQYHATLLNGAIIGSAFMINDGVVVTNAHVVSGRKPGDHVILSSQGRAEQSARIVAISTRMDLAILSVASGALPVVPHRPFAQKKGASVYAVGVAANSQNPRQKYVIAGKVLSGRQAIAPFGWGVIATMPHIKRGFSGGPVFNEDGTLVGMVAALRTASASGTHGREAFILSVEDIRAEVRRLGR